MKSILLAMLFFSSSFLCTSAFATAPKYVLAQYQLNVFFSPDPSNTYIRILEDGSVTKTVSRPNTKKEDTTDVAQLSEKVLANLKATIAKIPTNKDLYDPNPDQPMCMDAPGSSIKVYVDGKEVLTDSTAGCKEQYLEDNNAYRINTAIKGLVELAR